MTVEFLNNFDRNSSQMPDFPIAKPNVLHTTVSQLYSELCKTRSILCFNEIFIQMTVEFLKNFDRNSGQKPALPIANRMYSYIVNCSKLGQSCFLFSKFEVIEEVE